MAEDDQPSYGAGRLRPQPGLFAPRPEPDAIKAPVTAIVAPGVLTPLQRMTGIRHLEDYLKRDLDSWADTLRRISSSAVAPAFAQKRMGEIEALLVIVQALKREKAGDAR